MNKAFLTTVLVLGLLGSPTVRADEHGHKDEVAHADEGHTEDEEAHADEGHAEGEAAHADEPNGSIGPDKGITEYKEAHGFKLSPEAFKNFEIKMIPAPTGSVKLAKTSIFFGLQEQNLFRFRDGYFKRIDFKTISKSKTDFVVSSADLKPGDQIVISGVGFLRIAELAATGGVSDSHSH